MAAQRTFNPLGEGSNPSGLTNKLVSVPKLCRTGTPARKMSHFHEYPTGKNPRGARTPDGQECPSYDKSARTTTKVKFWDKR